MNNEEEFQGCKDAVIKFIIDNPGVGSDALMAEFGWSHYQKMSSMIRPLKSAYGLDPYKVFLFIGYVDRVPFYYEFGHAVKHKIERSILTNRKRNKDRNTADREKYAEDNCTLAKLKVEQHEGLMSLTRANHMMKVPETV